MTNKTTLDIPYFYYKQIIIAICPALIILFAIFLWAFLALKRNRLSYMRKELIGTIVIGMFLIHPTVISSSFSTWSCHELDTDEFWLIRDYSI